MNTLKNCFFNLFFDVYSELKRINADKMNITPDYLYKLIYRTDGVSPKEMIDRQIITTIKTYFQSTDLSVKNIAEVLNYDAPSYICFFSGR